MTGILKRGRRSHGKHATLKKSCGHTGEAMDTGAWDRQEQLYSLQGSVALLTP